MKILVCGAGGQVGRELVTVLGAQALALDRTALDIRYADAVQATLGRLRPDAVINAAAYTAVDRAEQEPEAAFAINRDGPAHLAAACAGLQIPLLHLSTDYVFDGSHSGAYSEDHTPAPSGVYGQSKWQGEQAVRVACPQHLVLRVSWVFGQHGHNFVKTMLRLARERPELRVVADQHGCPTHAGAIAQTLAALARRGAQREALAWGTYHYTGTPATTWHGFACHILQAAVGRGLLEHAPQVLPISSDDYPTPARRPANSVLDCTRIRDALGITPTPWEQGLNTVLDTLKATA